jgi:putative cell wall-binding protein
MDLSRSCAPGVRVLGLLGALTLLAALLAPAFPARAVAEEWLWGQSVTQTYTDSEGWPIYVAFTRAGYYGDPYGSTPVVGQVYRVAARIDAGMFKTELATFHLHMTLPEGTTIASDHTIECFGGPYEEDPQPLVGGIFMCPPTPVPTANGYDLGERLLPQNFDFYVSIPVISSQALGGVSDPAATLTVRTRTDAGSPAEVEAHQYVVVGGSGGVSPPPPPPPPPPEPTRPVRADAVRYAGTNRIETAAAISRATFPHGAELAFLATAANFPDALAGGPPAGALDAPILLTNHDALSPAVRQELARLAPDVVFILGSTGVISAAVEVELNHLVGAVERLAGPSRFETAAEIAQAFYDPGVPVVYIATGGNFPDALAGGAAAAIDGGPMLLVHADGIPPAVRDTLEWLVPEWIVVLGGAGAVSPAVEAELAGYADHIMRISGADRFATAAQIAATFPSLPTGTVFVATGGNFPDALAGVPATALAESPLLLVTAEQVPSVVIEQLRRLAPSQIVILGGPGVVPDAVVDQLIRY